MIRRILGSTTQYLFLLVLLSCATPMMHGVPVTWPDGFGNTPDVNSDTLTLNAANITLNPVVPSTVKIEALTADVNVNMNQSTVISGNGGGNSVLIVNALAPFNVIFNITNDFDLTFQGSAAGSPAPEDLLIVLLGTGNIIFNFDGGRTLTLTRNLSSGPGGTVQMYAAQKINAFVPQLDVTFQRSGANPDDNVETIVEEGAILSYIGLTAQPGAPTYETARINWNVANALNATGRMILTIGDTGAVIVRGRLTSTLDPDAITLANINPAIPAGYSAIFRTITDANGGSLLIQNYNNTLGEFVWDPWGNLDVRSNSLTFGSFSGAQYGFIVGSYGSLTIDANSYLDYVGLTGTQCPTPPIANASAQVKARSASALFTDGQPNPTFLPPQINIAANAGIYFRSGVDNEGNIRSITDPNPYTIDPALRTPGSGFPVFDIEGPLLITGAGSDVSAFQLLSLEVDPTGGPLITGGTQTIFPLRTFNTLSVTDPCTGITTDTYLSYNSGSFLNNGRVNLCSVSWLHTDQNHQVFENNDVSSEPAYIGGETWKIIPCITRPKWAFADSNFHIQMSVALTGVDLLVPENSFCTNPASCVDNESMFVFYQNGYAVDNGSGRNMILGTLIGSTSCDGCTVISKDAHLDVMQTATCTGGAGVLHELMLTTTQNNHDIVEAIPVGANLINQYSIQTIYLGNSSNISVGTNGTVGTSAEATLTTQYTFDLSTQPELLINGNFFSFETRGGENGIPSTSNVTGQGGIFVDTNGTISIGSNVCGYRTNIGAMVTRSGNGVIDLPKNRVFFDPTVGIATWNVNLNDPAEVVIVPQGASYSEYNLNWMFTQKDYNVFTPYEINCYNECSCPDVTAANITDIPTVQGIVEQFNLQGSRIGDVAHLKVDGGTIEELVMLVGCNSAEAPVAVLVLQNSALVGLGSTHRNVDSLRASIQLGVNGINLILNGDQATINLNEDVIINNTCSIIPGPDITADGILRFRSDCCTTLRVTADGILDLSAFTTGQTVEFGGNVRVVFEPGATVIYGADLGEGPTLRFADEATCYFEPQVNLNGIFTTDLTGTDTIRVVLTGVGVMEFVDCSRADLPRDAFVGVESLPLCLIAGADIRLRITDNAQFHIGDSECEIPGGVFQVGNTIDQLSPLITFSLILDGPLATFEIGPQGFFGLGVGIVDKPAAGHDSWLIAPTANVQKVSFDLRNGIFRHAQLYAGSDPDSALMALSNSINGNVLNQGFDFYADPLPGQAPAIYSGALLSNTTILGGGNFIAVNSSTSPFNPVVGTTNGVINAGQYAAGMFASTPIIQESVIQDVDAFSLQLLLRVQNVLDLAPTTNRGVAAPSNLRNQVRIGYVDTAGVPGSEGSIARLEVRNIVGKTPQIEVQQHALELGAVQVSLTPLSEGFSAPRPIIRVIEIGN